jgi:hypothetical protein
VSVDFPVSVDLHVEDVERFVASAVGGGLLKIISRFWRKGSGDQVARCRWLTKAGSSIAWPSEMGEDGTLEHGRPRVSSTEALA